mgnify:CR=1 FL=1
MAMARFLDAAARTIASISVPESRFGELASDAIHHIKSLIGVTAEVAVLMPGSVPRSQGKAVRVRDLRPKRD